MIGATFLLTVKPASAAAYNAVASVSPHIGYLNDTAGTVYTFTVRNTGTSTSIGAVEIRRPLSFWSVASCPFAPSGWTIQRADPMCRYRSVNSSTDDIQPGQSAQFGVTLTSLPGTQNQLGSFEVTVSSSNGFDNPSLLLVAAEGTGGLDIIAYSFQILDAVVANTASTPNSPCPASNKSAVTGSTHVIVICGKNRTTGSLTPNAANSALGGTFLSGSGTFSSGPISANSASSVVLGNWTGATVTSSSGSGKTINAEIGASTVQTSPVTTLTGYTAVNQPPHAVDDGPYTVLEDHTLNVAAPGVLGNDTDAENDPLTAQPDTGPSHGNLTLNTDGSFTYQPNPNYFGSDSFTYVANDGHANSAPATVSITVTAVNDPPSFALGGNQTVNEDAGAQTVPGFASSISAGPNESGQTVTLHVSNDNGSLFSTPPAIAPNGTLTYQPAANANGTANVSVYATDDGGTANGGSDTSPTQTFTITVTAVNDPPSFTLGGNQTVNEDAGAQTVPGFASSISAGPNESGQTVTLHVSNDNGSLFSTPPAIAPNGTLAYQPAANANGTANVSVYATDDGGTANGGSDTSPTQLFTITVTAVNDPPSFTAGPDQTVLEDSGAASVSPWATGISPGPADESSQSVTFAVTANSHPEYFSTGPTVSPSGALSFTPAADRFGSASITVAASDDGGTANGGQDTSAGQTFTITITAVNDPPSFTIGGNQTVAEDAGPQTVAGFATGISPGPFEGGQTVTFHVSSDNPGLFSSGPSIDASTGALTYQTAANVSGSANVSVYATDDGGTANGGTDTSPTQLFSISVTAVNDPPVAAAQSYDAQANMRISIPAASGLLTGAADPGDASDPGYTPTFTVGTASATSPPGGTVTFNAGTGAFTFDPPPGATGDVTFTYTVCDNGNPSPGVCSAPATVTVDVAGPVIWFVDPNAGSAGDGTLVSPFDDLGAATSAIGSATGERIFVYDGTTASGQGVSLNQDGWLVGQGASGSGFDSLMGISPPAGTVARPSINGTNPTIRGTVSMGGDDTVVRGVDIAPPSGSQGLVATTAGSYTGLEVGASSTQSDVTVSTQGATAVRLNNVTGTFAFVSVSADGGSNGISVTNANTSSGSFSVLGTGSAGSGGTIQNMSAHGISMSSTANLSFDRMSIHDTTLSGVAGGGVNGFSFTNGSINRSGLDGSLNPVTASNNVSSISFNEGPAAGTENNLSGSVTISGNTLTNALDHGVYVENYAGTVSDLTVSNNTITSTTSTTSSKGTGIRIQAAGSAATGAAITRATITGNTVRNFPAGAGISLQGGNTNAAGPATVMGTAGSGTNKVTISGNTVAGATPTNRIGTNAIFAQVGGKGQGNFDISGNGTAGNPLTNVIGAVISNSANGQAVVTSTISNNVIVANNAFGSQGIAASADQTVGIGATPSFTVTITGNSVSATNGNGILAVARNSSATMQAKVQNNTVAAPATAVPGIRVDSGSGAGNTTVCLNISGNTSAGGGTSKGIGLRKQGTVSNVNTFGVNGMVVTASPAVEAYVDVLNPAGGGTTLLSATSGFSNCSLP